MNSSNNQVVDIEQHFKAHHFFSGLPPYNGNLTFHYDETNNCRKFKLTKAGFNSNDAIKKDFVLGGIAFDISRPPNVTTLINNLGLQKAQEMKFASLTKKTSFLDIIEQKRISTFLDWLDKSNLYVHYLCQNNLYKSLVDIIDSICDENPSIHITEKQRLDYKNDFYHFVKGNLNNFSSVLVKHGFPAISNADVPSFCLDIKRLIDMNQKKNKSLRAIGNLLNLTSRGNSLQALNKRTQYYLIEDFSDQFIARLVVLKNSNHIFDREVTIQAILAAKTLLDAKGPCQRYKFVDSKQNQFIQVSDAFVGLMGRYFEFINTIKFSQYNGVISKLNQSQKDNFKKLSNLLDRSIREHDTFIAYLNPISEMKDRCTFLNMV